MIILIIKIIKAWHIIAMVAWFAGLFYLPRLFVYHSESYDALSCERFERMEKRLYYIIMWPAAIITTLLGILLVILGWPYYKMAMWLHIKFVLVGLVWCMHFMCGHYLKNFISRRKIRSTKFYRYLNEIPTILLISIVMLVVCRDI